MNPINDIEDDDIVTLTLDDDTEVDCQIIAIYPVGDKRYIALLPPEDFAEEGEVFIYGYEEDADGEPTLINIEDDEEYDMAADAFDELLDEEEYNELMADE